MEIMKQAVLTYEMEYRKRLGYKYVVTYNNTDKMFVYKDKFYKTLNGAKKFYDSLDTGRKMIREL